MEFSVKPPPSLPHKGRRRNAIDICLLIFDRYSLIFNPQPPKGGFLSYAIDPNYGTFTEQKSPLGDLGVFN